MVAARPSKFVELSAAGRDDKEPAYEHSEMPSQVVSSGRRKFLGHFDEGKHRQREFNFVKLFF